MKAKLSLKLLLTLMIVTAGLSVYSNYNTEEKLNAKPSCPMMKTSCGKIVKCKSATPVRTVTTPELMPWQNMSSKLFL